MIDFNSLNLNGIPNRKVSYYGSNEAFGLATEQENFVIDKIREIDKVGDWCTTTEFFEGFRSEENRIKGDIVGIYNGRPKIWIDVKVAYYNALPKYTGTITLNSILGFAKDSVNHYYLSVNKDGSKFAFIDAKKIYEIFKQKHCLLAPDNPNPKKENKNLSFMLRDMYIKNPPPFVSDDDYMPSFKFIEI